MRKLSFVLAMLFLQTVQGQNIDYAKQLIASEQYHEALEAIDGITDLSIVNKVNYMKGVIYFKQNSTDTAKQFFSKIPDGDRDEISLLARGRVALMNNNLTSAKNYFDKALQVTKNKNADVFYEVGDAYVTPKAVNIDEAISKLQEAIAFAPQNPYLYLRLGDAYIEKKDAGKALSQYENVVKFNDKISVVWLKMARINSNAHLFDVSCSNYEKFLALNSTNAIAWKEYGENLYYAGRYTEVAAAFEKYIELNNDDKEAKLNICILEYTFKNYEKAINCSKEYLAQDSTNYIAWRIISWANYELKNYEAGYAASLKFWAIDEKKVNPSDYIYSARLALQNKDTVRTLFFFDQALMSDSASADLYSEYGKALFALKRYDVAALNYENKNTKFGNSSVDVYYLGRAYYALNNYHKADSAFAVFVDKQPTSPDGYLWRAKSSSKMDTLDFQGLAFPYYEKFIEIAGVDAEKNKSNLVDAFIYLGVYYNSKNNNSKACEFLNKAIELDPENKFAKEMKSQMAC